MEKNIITLNESEFRSLIEGCVTEILEEGFFDQLGSAWKGAKNGFKGQKMLDRGTDNFKQNLDYWDIKKIGNPYESRPENTASEQAIEAYKRYKMYQQEANKFLNLYNALTKKYNLNKTGVGKVESKEKPVATPYTGISDKETPLQTFRKNHSRIYDMPTLSTRGLR